MRKQFLLMLLPVLVLASCGNSTSSSPSSTAQTSTSDSSGTKVDLAEFTYVDGLVSFENTASIITKGEGLTLGLSYGTGHSVTDVIGHYQSSDEAIMTVTTQGKIKAVKAGVVTIYYIAEVIADKEVCVASRTFTVLDDFPTLKQTLTNLTDMENYTLTITKDGADYKTITYTPKVVLIEDMSTKAYSGYALNADGTMAHGFTITDGVATFTDALKDQDGVVTAETFFGDDNPYYNIFTTFKSFDLNYLPDTATDGVYDIYNYVSDPDGTSDRDTINNINFAIMCDPEVYDGLYKRPYLSSLTVSQTSTFGLDIKLDAKLRKGTEYAYEAVVSDAGSSTIPEDILSLVGDKEIAAPTVDADLARGASLLKNAKSFVINKDNLNSIVATEKYYAIVDSDDAIKADYQNSVDYPDSYTFNATSYNTTGLVVQADGIYQFSQKVDVDTSTSPITITRETPVVDPNGWGALTDSTSMATYCHYPSTWTCLDKLEGFIPAGKFMALNYGNATMNFDILEAAFNDISNLPGAADFSFLESYQITPYYFIVDALSSPVTGVNNGSLVEKDSDCVVGLNLYCQTPSQVDKSSGASGPISIFSSFGVASEASLDAAFNK